MNRKPVPPRALLRLIAAGLMFPIGIAVVLGLSRLLAAMGDGAGSRVLDYVALSGGVLWVLSLIGLVLAVAVNALDGPDEPEDRS